MTVDTSRAAVEALIKKLHLWGDQAEIADNAASEFSNAQHGAAEALADLLDERDAAEEKYRSWLADRNRQKEVADDAEQRIRDLEATVDNLRLISNANGDWNIKYQEVNHRAERAEADRDRLSRGLDEAEAAIQAEVERTQKVRGERDKLAGKLDAMKAWATAEDKATEMSWSDYNIGRGDVAREALAILADTDEGKAGWVCSKCAREAVRGYDDGQIPEHHRTCSKRMPDTDKGSSDE